MRVSLIIMFLLVATGVQADDKPAPRDAAVIEAIIADVKAGWENADGFSVPLRGWRMEGRAYSFVDKTR